MSEDKDFGYFELLTKGIYLEKINSRFSRDFCLVKIDSDGIQLEQKNVSALSIIKGNDSTKKPIHISNIKEIRKGLQSDLLYNIYKGDKHQEMEKLCCCLVLHEGKTVNLKANTEDVRDAFLECMHYLKSRRQRMRELWYKEVFRRADKNGDNVLSIKEIVALLNELNINVSEFYVVFLIQKESLNMVEFIELIRRLQSRKTVENLFWKYSGGKETMSVEDLIKMFAEQQDSIASTTGKEIVDTFEEGEEYRQNGRLTLEGFYQLLSSKYFDAFNHRYAEVYQDMNQPITHYFIDSSHNTYLEGDQVMSSSKVECYVTVLKMGCRCVEIDVWDGSDGEPVVTHGYAGTSKLLFVDVIDAIKDHAFDNSEYPVILSLENHCSPEQQKKMASIMKDLFKESIFIGPIDDEKCPSPEQLKRKIIIKCQKVEPLRSNSSVESEGPDDDAGTASDVKHKAVKTVVELGDLVAIYNFKHVCSFDENKAKKFKRVEFMEHNMRVMSRIYPQGMRMRSSNYDPMPFWLSGCQLVALNHQTGTQPMFLNRGLFSDNGSCGYVLKPEYQRSAKCLNEFKSASEPKKKLFKIEILDGFCLPKKPNDSITSILDPFVRVTVAGQPNDCCTFETVHVENNGFNPSWNHPILFLVKNSQMALILIEVIDHGNVSKDSVVAQCCIRADTLVPGFRMIHLKNMAGIEIPGDLLVKIDIITG